MWRVNSWLPRTLRYIWVKLKEHKTLDVKEVSLVILSLIQKGKYDHYYEWSSVERVRINADESQDINGDNARDSEKVVKGKAESKEIKVEKDTLPPLFPQRLQKHQEETY